MAYFILRRFKATRENILAALPLEHFLALYLFGAQIFFSGINHKERCLSIINIEAGRLIGALVNVIIDIPRVIIAFGITVAHG
jgi:hypothetical protein